jgi:hypothetical protein
LLFAHQFMGQSVFTHLSLPFTRIARNPRPDYTPNRDNKQICFINFSNEVGPALF